MRVDSGERSEPVTLDIYPDPAPGEEGRAGMMSHYPAPLWWSEDGMVRWTRIGGRWPDADRFSEEKIGTRFETPDGGRSVHMASNVVFPYSRLLAWQAGMAARGATVDSLGRSFEGRRIPRLFLPMINVDGNVHGRNGWTLENVNPYEDFHGFLGTRAFSDPPYDGLYVLEKPRELYGSSGQAERYATIQDTLVWDTPGLTAAGRPGILGPEPLCYNLARLRYVDRVLRDQSCVPRGLGCQAQGRRRLPRGTASGTPEAHRQVRG